MGGLIVFVIGGVVGAGLILALGHRVVARRQAEIKKYKEMWLEATELLGEGGQLPAEQVRVLGGVQALPQSSGTLPTKPGFSGDRAAIEIMRAKKGLPPADSLYGMFSGDVRKVEKARLRYASRQKPQHP